MASFLCIGMSICLLICTVFPNGLNLRPEVFTRDNLFIDLVKGLYATDTPTNVCPSIHVYNSIGVHIAVVRAKSLENKRYVRIISLITCILICMSTMFLKQHSVIDVCAACILAFIMYHLTFCPFFLKDRQKVSERVVE